MPRETAHLCLFCKFKAAAACQLDDDSGVNEWLSFLGLRGEAERMKPRGSLPQESGRAGRTLGHFWLRLLPFSEEVLRRQLLCGFLALLSRGSPGSKVGGQAAVAPGSQVGNGSV